MSSLTWSASRARTFQQCRRRYYYRYHLVPQARRAGAPPEAMEADRVKDLMGLETWCGNLVHHLLEQALNRWRAGREFSEAQALAQAKQQLSRQFRDSLEYWTAPAEQFPHRPPLLDLHYYGDGQLSREHARSLRERVETSLLAFFRSGLAHEIRRAGVDRWLPIERYAAASLEEGLVVLVKPDYAFLDEDGLLRILDWKTGQPDPFWELVQVTCYALYAAEKWRQPLAAIVPHIARLYPEFELTTAEYTPESLREVRSFIRESHAEIRALEGPDAHPAPERFPLAEDRGICRWCPFRGLCEGGGADRSFA